ncbi:MAG: LysR family transcriptional regulator [Pseudobdellovibrionaceae bacterium]
MIQNLTYELSVLSKAIQHKNLSAAAQHIGLSQPQLSRLIAKIESELSVILLDRSARRKSGWTPLAHDLSLTFTKGISRLQSDILSVAQESEVHELRIGTLEGLSAIATQFVQHCFDKINIPTVYLDVLDFRDLDSQFLSGNLDLIFSVRPPSKQKYKHQLEVGYQQMEKISTNKEIYIFSPFEFTGAEKKSMEPGKKTLISNSLSFRSHWLHQIGGTGILPIDAKRGRGKGYYSVNLFGSDLISPKLWTLISEFNL